MCPGALRGRCWGDSLASPQAPARFLINFNACLVWHRADFGLWAPETPLEEVR